MLLIVAGQRAKILVQSQLAGVLQSLAELEERQQLAAALGLVQLQAHCSVMSQEQGWSEGQQQRTELPRKLVEPRLMCWCLEWLQVEWVVSQWAEQEAELAVFEAEVLVFGVQLVGQLLVEFEAGWVVFGVQWGRWEAKFEAEQAKFEVEWAVFGVEQVGLQLALWALSEVEFEAGQAEFEVGSGVKQAEFEAARVEWMVRQVEFEVGQVVFGVVEAELEQVEWAESEERRHRSGAERVEFEVGFEAELTQLQVVPAVLLVEPVEQAESGFELDPWRQLQVGYSQMALFGHWWQEQYFQKQGCSSLDLIEYFNCWIQKESQLGHFLHFEAGHPDWGLSFLLLAALDFPAA